MKTVKQLFKKIKEIIAKNRMISIIFVLAFIVGLLSLIKLEVLDTGFYTARIPSIPLRKDTAIKQEFFVKGDLSGISIKFGTYDSVLKGLVWIRIKDKKKRLFIKKIPAENIVNNRFTHFKVDSSIPSGSYHMIVSYSPVDSKEKLSVWLSRGDKYPRGRLYVNGEKMQGDMIFRVYYKANILAVLGIFSHRFYLFSSCMIFSILFLYLLIAVFLFVKIKRVN